MRYLFFIIEILCYDSKNDFIMSSDDNAYGCLYLKRVKLILNIKQINWQTIFIIL